jgi:squalene cyclase
VRLVVATVEPGGREREREREEKKKKMNVYIEERKTSGCS